MMIEEFKDSLTVLKTILEKIENNRDNWRTRNRASKRNNKRRVERIRNKKIDELEKLHEKLRFGTVKNIFWERLNSIEEETELREIIRKKINEIDSLETEIKDVKELKIEGESKATKLLADLNFDKGVHVDEIIEIEIRLEKLKISEKKINAIKKSIVI